MHDDRRAQLAEPLLAGGVVRKTSEGSVSKRLSSSGHRIESHRHRHEAVYRKGTALREREKVAYDFKSPVAFPVGEMREFVAGPSSVENPESAEELAHAQQRFNEMSKMHHASHLHPVPHSVHELLHQLALAAAFVFLFMTSTWSSAHAKAHGGGEEEEEGGGGEGAHGGDESAGAHGAHHETGEVDAQSTVIIVAFLIAMTLGFEFAKDMAEEAVPREMRPVLGQIFSEFTVLGFMAMVTYFMIQANVLAAASSLVYHDPEHLVHLFEKVHFDLFFVLIARN